MSSIKHLKKNNLYKAVGVAHDLTYTQVKLLMVSKIPLIFHMN